MGGELVKSTGLNNKSSRNMVSVNHRNFKTANLKETSIKKPKNNSFSQKKIKEKFKKLH